MWDLLRLTWRWWKGSCMSLFLSRLPRQQYYSKSLSWVRLFMLVWLGCIWFFYIFLRRDFFLSKSRPVGFCLDSFLLDGNIADAGFPHHLFTWYAITPTDPLLDLESANCAADVGQSDLKFVIMGQLFRIRVTRHFQFIGETFPQPMDEVGTFPQL